jgi:membrane protease YdiL (CAAX protease family)
MKSLSSSPLVPSRVVGWPAIISIVVGYIIILSLYFGLINLFPDDPLYSATHGLIDMLFCISTIFIGLEFIIFFKWIGLGAQDVGLIRSRVLGGIIAYFSLWGLSQILFIVLGLIDQNTVTIASYWFNPFRYLTIIGIFLTYSIGVAVSEELLFRGFLVPQVWQLTKNNSPWKRLAITIGISQGLFTLIHIPSIFFNGFSPLGAVIQLLSIFGIGILLTLIWLQTQNLFIAMAFHGLADGMIPLVHQSVIMDKSWLSWVYAGVFLIVYPLITRKAGIRKSIYSQVAQ